MPVSDIRGDSAEDAALLKAMGDDAVRFIRSFRWCPPIDRVYFGDGVGGIIAIFLITFREKVGGTDDSLWVVVGALPRAYFVVEDEETPREAIGKYCDLMWDWTTTVLSDGPLGDVFPVSVPATHENAVDLRKRIEFVRREIVNRAPR